jgi:hypothetical protein
MFYRLLGMAVWKGAKTLLRYKYGRMYVPKPVLAGALLAGIGALVVVFARGNASDS